MSGSNSTDEQKEEHRLGTIHRWDPPEGEWAAEFDWTRYRGPAPWPVPGGWVFKDPEEGGWWQYFGDAGVGHDSDDSILDELEADDAVEDPYEALEEARGVYAFLGVETANPDEVSLRDSEDEELEWTLEVAGIEVFRRVEPDRSDLMAAVAEALAAYHEGELEERREAIVPESGRKPDDVLEAEALERRQEENESLDDFATDGGSDATTHIDDGSGLWIPPELREFTGQVVFRTPRATIQHFERDGGQLDPYYSMIDETHFGDPEAMLDPKNPELAPDRVRIKPQGEDPVTLRVDHDAELRADGSGTSTDDRARSWINEIHEGDAVETLQQLPESSVHCVVTSPPYFGQRDYGVDGQIGLEGSLSEFIASIVEVGDELRRVLRDDGNWWLNLGDTFAGSQNGRSMEGETKESQPPEGRPSLGSAPLPRKSKMLVPHRVAIALQDAGWIVRGDAVWHKPNPTPNPVKDRLHEHKEFLFHLTPKQHYWFDLDAVREPHQEASIERAQRDYDGSKQHDLDRYPDREVKSRLHSFDDPLHPNGKNPGDVLEIPVQAFPEAHFAVFPTDLPELPIKSSCPPKVCAECAAPYERDVEEVPVWERDRSTIEREQLQRALHRYDKSDLTEEHLKAARAKGFSDAAAGKQQIGAGRNAERVEMLAEEAKDVLGGYFRELTMTGRETGDWVKSCDCETDEIEPGIVLDPFCGAGTTCLVGKQLGRRFVGVELNPEYVAMAQRRVGITVDEPDRLLEADDQKTLLAATDGGNGRPQDTDDCREGGS